MSLRSFFVLDAKRAGFSELRSPLFKRNCECTKGTKPFRYGCYLSYNTYSMPFAFFGKKKVAAPSIGSDKIICYWLRAFSAFSLTVARISSDTCSTSKAASSVFLFDIVAVIAHLVDTLLNIGCYLQTAFTCKVELFFYSHILATEQRENTGNSRYSRQPSLRIYASNLCTSIIGTRFSRTKNPQSLT